MSSGDNKNNSPETNPPTDSQALVDIDTIKIKVLFICKNKRTYDSAASYLIRRGWETIVLGSIKEAFSTIASFKPDFVAVSVNLPTNKIQQLPTVIYNTFRCPVITFGEQTDTKTLGLLQTTVSNYKMPGAVSGPSAHRRIKQILQEIYRPDIAAAKQSADAKNSAEEGSRIIHGRNESESPSVYRTEGENENKGTSNKGTMIFKSDKKEAGPGFIIAKNDSKKPDVEIDKLAALFTDEENSKESASENLVNSEIHASEQDQSNLNQETVNQDFYKSKTEAATNLPATNNDANTSAEKNSVQKRDLSAKFDAAEFKSAILQLVKESMPQSKVDQPSFKNNWPVEMTTWATEINGETGYLSIQYKGPKSDLAQINERLINKIKAHYESIGATCFIYDEITIRIATEEFGVGDEESIFTEHLSIYDGEVVVRFTRAVLEKPNLELDSKLKKYRVFVAEMVENVNVGASLYLYLPKNERFYLYLKEASALSAKQKQKLISSNTTLYINEDDVKNYERTYSRNKAIEKILKYKRKPAA